MFHRSKCARFSYTWELPGFCHITTHQLSPQFSDDEGKYPGIRFQLKVIPMDYFEYDDKITGIELSMPRVDCDELEAQYRIWIIDAQNKERRVKGMYWQQYFGDILYNFVYIFSWSIQV